jgi:hypothetical protein
MEMVAHRAVEHPGEAAAARLISHRMPQCLERHL